MTYTGDAVGYRVTTTQGDFVAEVTSSSSDLPSAGDQVQLSWDPADAYLLPLEEATGR
jgi:hypothetical protein